ncbi:MAG TPA: sugar ABC transporter permease, partial [Desulfobacteraceae bacterium]|nr:sugar ABC transporter permease [Desulfobacteraceae bacterium]
MLERTNRFGKKPAQGGSNLWRKKKVSEAAFGYAFILPFFLLMFILTFVVYAIGLSISFTDAANINPGSFIGFDNYTQLFQQTKESKDFFKAFGSTFYYAIGCLVTQIPAAFILAYILNNVPKGVRSPLRAAFFVPVLINSVVIALLFRMIFSRDTGIINWVLGLVGLPNNTDWLQDSTWAIPLLIIVSFWQWTGFH